MDDGGHRLGPGLRLGTTGTEPAQDVMLPVEALLRHVVALGSSGSGKTVLAKVLVEEAVLAGIPVLAVDPQGDLGSLALEADPEELRTHGVDPARAAELGRRADVVIFTPGSRKGVPLCVDPTDVGDLGNPEQLVLARTRVASMVASLLGYGLDGDEGQGVVAVLHRSLEDLAGTQRSASLAAIAEHVTHQEASDFTEWAELLQPSKIAGLCRKLRRLDVGARRALFHDGIPMDIPTLLGLGAHAEEGRTRVAIVHLNSLPSQEDKDFVVAALADRLYRWMLAHPSPRPQVLFYIDEVAPFVPPVAKPACKEGLAVLFKQARKYGVCCLMATQNPGDIDYRALAQFGTWALGRLTTRQDLRKVEPAIAALSPDSAAEVLRLLPRLKPGQMILLSPDSFSHPCPLQTRWLLTPHRTLTDDAIETLARGRWRERFSATEVTSTRVDLPTESAEAVATRPFRIDGAEAFSPEAPTVSITVQVGAAAQPAQGLPPELLAHAAELASRPSMTPTELSKATGLPKRSAGDALEAMVAAGVAGTFRDGRTVRYWALALGTRPDLDMPPTVCAVATVVDVKRAEAIGRAAAHAPVLGVLGEAERFDSAALVHRLLYRVEFEEKVPTGWLGKLIGPGSEERLGNVYIEPSTLKLLVMTTAEGIRFHDKPANRPSEIRDLDGAATFVDVPPGALALDEDEWKGRPSAETLRDRFTSTYEARPRGVHPIFFPLWRLLLSNGSGTGQRLVTVDGLLGRVVDWPAAPAPGRKKRPARANEKVKRPRRTKKRGAGRGRA